MDVWVSLCKLSLAILWRGGLPFQGICRYFSLVLMLPAGMQTSISIIDIAVAKRSNGRECRYRCRLPLTVIDIAAHRLVSADCWRDGSLHACSGRRRAASLVRQFRGHRQYAYPERLYIFFAMINCREAAGYLAGMCFIASSPIYFDTFVMISSSPIFQRQWKYKAEARQPCP